MVLDGFRSFHVLVPYLPMYNTHPNFLPLFQKNKISRQILRIKTSIFSLY